MGDICCKICCCGLCCGGCCSCCNRGEALVGEEFAIGVVGRDELEAAGLTATGGCARMAANVISCVESAAALLLAPLLPLLTGDWLGKDEVLTAFVVEAAAALACRLGLPW